jgi:phenylalanyl-tRNA synthetase beta chain
MRFTLSLIRSFIDIDLPVSKIGEKLTLLGIEVDQIHNEFPPFSHVVVGDVLSVKPHPNANKLQIATVTDGKETVEVVCGAPNCREGIKTAFAKIGATLKGSGGDPLVIKKSTIRGAESNGMLCSEAELSLSNRHEGICELPRELETGTDLQSILWDPVFEISLTPNLGHCMSALGIARELSAAFQIPLKIKKTALHEKGASIEKKVKVSVSDFNLCQRYMCRLIEEIKVAPSPFWLQRQLLSAGLNPISNIVDITNFILLKWGQPLHAFDFNKLSSHQLAVAPSKKQENFVGLDGETRNLPPGSLLISDKEKPVAIAGILGGQNSAVSDTTQAVLIEAAVFNPSCVRALSKHLGLRTESSNRFEKGVDPVAVERALEDAVSLILQLAGGKLAEGVIDLKESSFVPKKISCRLDKINKTLGTLFSPGEIEEIFHRLQFEASLGASQVFQVSVPLFRSDINEEIDLIEEVARIYGYDHLEKKVSSYTASSIPHDPLYLFEKEVKERLIGLGLQEFLTSDLISPKLAGLAQELIQPDITYLQALHAKTEEYSVLRPSLLPNFLQLAKTNLDHKNQTIRGFEIGRIHFLQKEKLYEQPMVSLLLTGKRNPHHWSQETKDVDFYDLKGILENLFEGLKIAHFKIEPATHLSFHPFAAANIYIHDLLVGSFGEVHPSLLAKMDIKQKLFFCEMHLTHLMNAEKIQKRMHPIALFPSSERDWTLPLPSRMHLQEILQEIYSSKSPLLTKIEVLDLYLPEDHLTKNVTIRFTYRDLYKTISLEEVEIEHTKMVENISKLLAK